jgi:arabinofuranan 3-O-arabinosyltransferase
VARTGTRAAVRRWVRGADGYRTTVVVGLIVLAVVVFRNGGDSVYFDTRPDFYLEPWRTLTRFYSAWTSTPYLGNPNYHTGAITSVAPLAALGALGLTPGAIFTTWHLVLLVLAAWGTTRLVRHLLPELSRYAALFAGVVYIANPWSIDGASVLPITLSLALLPWQVLWLLKAFDEPRSWRWPALFGFTFFAMAGSNAAVQPLFGLVVVPVAAVYAWRTLALRWRDVAAVVGKCVLFVVVLSAYWLPATFAAGRAGSAHADTTETLESIAFTSSFAELLRGLGFWPLYGGDAEGPWIAAHTSYVDSWFVVVATFVAAGLALASLLAVRARVRRVLISLVVVAVVLMVGVYPWSSPSPFGRAMRWTFENVPLTVLFRTTNKVGEVLVLALAVASAAGVAWLFTHVSRRWLTAPLLLLVMIGISFPAWQGKLYASEWPIPSYWKEAGRSLDQGPADQRTLVMPGYVTATYRWRGSGRPDELLYGLTKRNVVVPAAVQNTTPAAFNFMSALDDTFQSETGPATSLSAFARLLGADQVLVRHDWPWETVGGIRPSEVNRAVTADSGLEPIRNFGDPGENVQGPGQEPDGFFEKFVPPLQLYGVPSAPAMVRAEPLGSASVVAGDGWAVPAMERAGLLRQDSPFRYAHDLSAGELGSLLGPNHQIVVTDTNRRRDIVPGTVTHGNGRLLAADEPLARATRTLGTDSADQTVLSTGTVRATENLAAKLPEQLPGSSPANVLDGDASTSWLAGTGSSALGSTLTLRLPEARRLGTVTIDQPLRGPLIVRWVELRAGGQTRRVDLSAGPATVDLGDLTADKVSLTVESLNGLGANAVGLSDVSISGLKVTPRAKLPTTIDDLYAKLSPVEQARFRQTPLDILMTRARGADGADDEAALHREFTTSTARDFRVRAQAHIDTSREDLLDRSAGVPSGATSSSVFFDNPDLRASQAFDGDPTTGWLTGGALVGSSIERRGRERDLSTISFTQRAWTKKGPTNWITAVDVYVDGTKVRTAAVKPGTTRVPLVDAGQVLRGRTIKIVVSADTDPSIATSPIVAEIDDGLTPKAGSDDAKGACIDLALVDGKPLAMRLSDAAKNEWVACGSPLSLASGTHRVEPVEEGVVVDSLDLLGVPQEAAQPVGVAPGLTFTSDMGSHVRAEVGASLSDDPYVLVLSQAFDDRWRATVDGKKLGKPFLVDGHAMGWVVDSPGSHDVDLTFGPQRETDIGAAVTGAGLLAVGALAVLPRRRPRVVPRREPARRRLRVPPAAGWLAFVVGVYAVSSWTGLIAALVLAGWHWFRAPDPRTLALAGAGLVVAAGIVTVVYLGVPGDFSYVATGPVPNAMAVVGLVLVVLGGWRHRSAARDDAGD